MNPKMTKKLAIQMALNPGDYSVAQLVGARARLAESLEKGTAGGYSEHMYVQDCAKAIDKAINSRE